MNKEIVKRLLKDHTCDNCHHCFDKEKVCWIDSYDKPTNLPEVNTCENFRPRNPQQQAREKLIRKWSNV